MDELITRALSGEASAFEMERLDRWRTETPDNERYFQEVAQIWSLTSPESAPVSSEPPPAEEIVRAAEAEHILAAWRHVVDRVPTACLLIVGGGPLLKSLVQESLRLGLTEQTRFIGAVPHCEIPA